MKNVIIIGMLFLFFLLLGCTNNEGIAFVEEMGLDAAEETICGDGIVQKGETYENCCKDVPCPDTFKCSSTMKEGDIVYYCEKIELSETYEFSKFIQSYNRYSNYNVEQSETEYFKLLEDIKTSREYLNELNQQGYDVSFYIEFLNIYERRIKFNQVIYTEKLNFENINDKEIIIKKIDEAIELYGDEKINLQSINSSMKRELDEKMDYDIDEKIDYINEVIIELNKLKNQVKLGINAELIFSNYQSECSSYSTYESGYVNKIYITIKNTGGFDINNPVIDIYLLDGSKEIDKDLGETLSYSRLKPGESISYEYWGMLGYNSKDSTKCGNYKIKIDIRDGNNPNIITTGTYNIEIK